MNDTGKLSKLLTRVYSPGGILPFKNDEGARRKLSKRPQKGTRISFCGRGFIFTPKRCQF